MFNVDFSQVLGTMSKAQILSTVEAQLDRAIALKIEEEAALAAYTKAKANVANDTYTKADLDVLQKHLGSKSNRDRGSFTITQKELTDAEFNDIVDALLSGRGKDTVKRKISF